MPLLGLHCQVSKLVNSDTCPRPATPGRGVRVARESLSVSHRLGLSPRGGPVRPLAMDNTVIPTETDSNDSKVTVYTSIP
jgi:hypothetical protein